MVKLLRLTHNKDPSIINAPEGLTFNTNLESDLVVSEDAQIGVKNLTFEADFQVLTITGVNNTITAKYDTARDASTDRLTVASYVKSTYLDFFDDLNITLNKCLNPLLVGDTATINKQGFYAQYNVDKDTESKPIVFKLTPALNPVINRDFIDPTNPESGNFQEWDFNGNLMVSSDSADLRPEVDINYNRILPTNQLKPSDMCILKSAGNAQTTTRNRYLASSRPDVILSRGSSVWSVRIGELTDVADGGFEIGLASDIPFGVANSPILDEDVKFSVRVTTKTSDFQHIKPTSDFTSNPTYVQNTGIKPTNPQPANSAESDTIVLSCSHRSNTAHRKKLTAEVFRNGVQVRKLFSYDFPEGKEDTPLYPYICMFEPTANATNAHSPVVTFDPFGLDDALSGVDLDPSQGNTFAGAEVFGEGSINYGLDGYFNLENGGANWTQAPTPATENFDTTNLGDIATYRRTQQGSSLVQWWEATGANTWNLYNGSSPPVAGDAPDNTAVTDATTGVITFPSGATFTPATQPVRVEKVARIGLPDLDEDWYLNRGLNEKTSLSINNRILAFLGFTKEQTTGDMDDETQFPVIISTTRVPYGFIIQPDGVFALAQSDNFVVILDSQKLISYDCSTGIKGVVDKKGQRANILATIPVNNNNGVVEFQSSEVLFIDMDNKQPLAIKNLSLRVLDKQLRPIQVEGVSVITLLIKD